MSLSRSPSPQPGGGWSSPGLTTPTYTGASGSSSPMWSYPNGGGAHNVTWASASARSKQVKGYQAAGFSTRNPSWFKRHLRKWSSSLPQFTHSANGQYAEKEKLGRGRWEPSDGSRLSEYLSWAWRRFRLSHWKLLIILFLLSVFMLLKVPPIQRAWNRTSFLGGGSKFVIILAANQGGGVMEWKGPREWAIERDSVKNKKKYARKWGYDLEIVDMSTKKRYAHEWRESWEKVDTVRNAMRKYPQAEWFWWLDLNTFIMEPTYSLQSHIFNSLASNTYRDINYYNPLNITHPLTAPWLDPQSLSLDGDGNPDSINFILSQDCGGFNLGSFFVRRSKWTDRLLDIWWDPVGYEQRHMQWEHKEQDALEYLYENQPWVRPHLAFIGQRKVNSFPPGACGDNGIDPKIHYSDQERDFVVNMAGCEWGRDCWGEMYSYRELSHRLNRNWWERLRGWFVEGPAQMDQQQQQQQQQPQIGDAQQQERLMGVQEQEQQ
ncbi:glycosyltransferase family 34 protein [Saccharata proteae CBS 121410]|uniref:Glycosyltransferase family 34 protein n=1 Tax=Saccharata proteae CBS 121410 TaxID=1314787 RepID=A0A9P4HZ91_9PEZI|nr:glycosyltransferase family 34 protein [Saccharata proteae CBS 121410]